jgi:putative nucleotidyltransferase with HDIG domain
MTPPTGTDGTTMISPVWGRMQASRRFLQKSLASQSSKLGIYLGALATCAASCLVWVAHTWPLEGQLWVVGFLAVVAAIAERARVSLSGTVQASGSLVTTIFAAVLFGPMASMLVAVSSVAADVKRPYMKWAIYTSSRAITGAMMGVMAQSAEPLANNRLGSIAVATAAAAMTAVVLDSLLTSLTLRIRGTSTVTEVLRAVAPAISSSLAVHVPLVALLAFAYETLSIWTLPLFFIPALAAQRLFLLYQRQRQLTEKLITVNERLGHANLSFATALVATLDARDRYTAGHSAAVAVYARDISTRMGLSPEKQRLAHLCGLVHDIGKIGLPPGLLEKPGALTLDERRLMEKHSEIGERILAKVDDYAEIAKIVRHHHERVDGQGYPDGLFGSEIPLISRIIAVADAYNAMTSDRPYRDAMPSPVARMRLAQAVESQFDTAVVAAFEAILASATEEYRAGIRMDFGFVREEPQPEPLRVVSVA